MTADNEIEEHVSTALALAVARFLREHAVTGEAELWVTPQAREWAQAPEEQLNAEAARRREELDRWRDRVKAEEPEVWEVWRPRWLNAGHWLGSARTGSFATSSGSLYDFLVAAGAETRELEIF